MASMVDEGLVCPPPQPCWTKVCDGPSTRSARLEEEVMPLVGWGIASRERDQFQQKKGPYMRSRAQWFVRGVWS